MFAGGFVWCSPRLRSGWRVNVVSLNFHYSFREALVISLFAPRCCTLQSRFFIHLICKRPSFLQFQHHYNGLSRPCVHCSIIKFTPSFTTFEADYLTTTSSIRDQSYKHCSTGCQEPRVTCSSLTRTILSKGNLLGLICHSATSVRSNDDDSFSS